MKKDKQVYCTCCVYGPGFIQWFDDMEKRQDIGDIHSPIVPTKCRSCYLDCPWDSRSLLLRVNYKESFSGWLWQTFQNLEQFSRILFWKFVLMGRNKKSKDSFDIKPEDFYMVSKTGRRDKND